MLKKLKKNKNRVNVDNVLSDWFQDYIGISVESDSESAIEYRNKDRRNAQLFFFKKQERAL